MNTTGGCTVPECWGHLTPDRRHLLCIRHIIDPTAPPVPPWCECTHPRTASVWGQPYCKRCGGPILPFTGSNTRTPERAAQILDATAHGFPGPLPHHHRTARMAPPTPPPPLTIPTNREEVRGEGVWHYVETDWMSSSDAIAIHNAAQALNVELAYCGPGSASKLRRAIRLIQQYLTDNP